MARKLRFREATIEIIRFAKPVIVETVSFVINDTIFEINVVTVAGIFKTVDISY